MTGAALIQASFFSLVLSGAAVAQDRGTLDPKPLPPLANPDDPSTPAKQLFGRRTKPTTGPSLVHGFYAKGCLAGAVSLPIDGDAWQVMRLSRNRNWGSSTLVSFLERMARQDRAAHIWPGLLVGDMAQPRGGPMITGHASHQIGLDADIWLLPMPDRTLSRNEREEMPSSNVVRDDELDVNATWSPRHMALIRSFAQQKEVQRIFVNPAIKKAICRDARGDRSWLAKVRPEHGHNYHFHVRLACPAGQPDCDGQNPPPPGDGCDETLAWWFRDEVMHPRPNPNWKPRPPMTMASLPAACRRVLNAP
jgi:penicillin-insensitive murein endopeptidase